MVKTVMVISPLEVLRTTLESLIIHSGYTVSVGIGTVVAFPHALNASETRPNIILLDYWLSRSVTIDFIRSLKKQGFAVILMGSKFLGQEIARSEGVFFLEKPFTYSTLLKVLQIVKP